MTVGYTDPTVGTNDVSAIQDAAGNDAATITTQAVTNNTLSTDTTAPVFASAAVNGSTLVLTYTEANTLDSTHLPAASFFTVSGGHSVTTVAVDAAAKTVTLMLGTAVANGETVTVSYTDPTAGNDSSAIQDAAGNDAATITAQTVVNNTPNPVSDFITIANKTYTYNSTSGRTAVQFDLCFAAALIGGSKISGAVIDLLYQSDQVVSSLVTSPSFDYTDGNGDLVTGAKVWSNTVNNLVGASANGGIALTVDPALINYDPIIDANGKVLTVKLYVTGNVTDFPVSLQSNANSGVNYITTADVVKHVLDGGYLPIVPTVDTTAPLFASAAVNGSTLVLTYTDANALDATHLPAASFFTVSGGHSVTTVAVDAAAKTVTLTLGTAVLSGETVTVGYTDPTVGTNDVSAIQDAAGNDAATITAQAVTNNTLSTDTTAPVFASAAVNGSTLVLTYTEANTLDSTHLPAASAFTVSGGHTVTAVAVDAAAKTVTLTLGTAVSNGETVTVGYTDPTVGTNDVNAIQDAAGNDAATITAQTVVNNTPDTTAPVFASAAVNGSTLVLSYTEANTLDATNVPAASAFTVSGGHTVNAVAVDAAAKTVTLTLGTAVASGEAVTVGYTDPAAGNDTNAIQDAAGNDAATITLQAVTNNTLDTTAPVFLSAAVNGSTLVLSYTEANTLDATNVPAANAFTVSGGHTVNAVAVDAAAKTVTLTLGTAVASGEAVTVGYTDPTVGTNDVNAIQDAAGNDAATITAQAVANNTPDTTAPLFANAAVNGNTLVLTYTEANTLDATNVPAASAFTVSGGHTVNAVAVDAAAKTVTLTLGTAVSNGETVTVGYTDPTVGNDANSIQDAAGNDAATITAQLVTNNTPLPPPTSALVLTSVKTDAGVNVEIWLKAGTVIDTADLDLSYDTTKVNYTGAVSNPALVGWLSESYPASPGHVLIAAMSTDFSSINNSTNDTLLETISFTLLPGSNEFSVSLVSGTGLSIGDQPVEPGLLPTLLIYPTDPTVAVSSAALTNDSTPVVSGTADAGSTVTAVIAGATYTTTVAGGTWSIDTGSAQPTSGTLGLDINGSNSVRVTSSNAAGHTSSPATQTLVIDTLAPSVSTVTDATVASVTKDAITFTVTFDEAVVGTVGTGSFTATNGTVSSVASVGGNAYTVVVTPTAGVASGNVALSLVGTGLTDTAGNQVVSADLSSKVSQGIDTQAPTTTVSSLVLSEDTGTSSTDFITKTAAQTISGTLSAVTVTGEVVKVSTDNGATWTTATNTIGQAGFSLSGVTLTGNNTLKVQVEDTAGNVGTATSQAYELDTVSPTTTMSTLLFSADTGTSSTDFITKTAAQTISGTLSAVTVTGEVVKVSTDNGATWTTATNTIGQNSFSLTGVTLTGNNTLKVQVEDAAGNASIVKSQAYVLDTTAPSVISVTDTTVALVTKDAITFTVTFDDAIVGTVDTSSFTATNGTVNSVTSAGGNVYTVVVTPTAGVASGNVALSLVGTGLTDAAGNTVVSADLSGKDSQGIDTQALATTISTLLFSADTGTSSTDFITKTAAQTISGTLSAVTERGEVVRVSTDNGATWTTATNTIGQNGFSLTGVTLTGNNTLKVQVEDTAGNVGTATSQAYVLDAVAPTTTISGLALSADTGTPADFITNTAAQTVTGTLSAALVAGESLFGSLDNGAHWTDITSKVNATSISWNGVTLSGSSTMKVEARDAAGNAGIAASHTYTLETVYVNHDPTGEVTIEGTLESGQKLTADTSTLKDADGIGSALSYQWSAGGVALSDAVNRTYTLTPAEVGKAMTVVVSYIDGHNKTEKIESSQTPIVILPPNILPIGQTSIFGTTTQNETLTASYALSDANGINSDTIKYQWKADGVNIENATNSDLVLGQAQVGKNISVVVSYSDLNNYHESVESRLTAAVANVNDAPTGSITITGAALAYEKLTASNDIQDLDGISGGITYQWQKDGVNIFGATDQYYILTSSEANKKITVTASYTDAYGHKESVVSAATAPVDPGEIPATGFVTINGTATQNKTLIENHSITDLNGLGSSTFLYQWRADGKDIAGATERTYQIKEAEVGKTITVSVSFVDDDGYTERLVSSETRAVVNVNDAPSGTVTIDGTAAEDKTLTVNSTALHDLDGIPAGALHYQWKADGNSIAGATKSTYTLTQAEVDAIITVQLSYTDGHGTLESNSSVLTSAATDVVVNVNDLPRIQEGHKLIVADNGVVVNAILQVNTGFLIDEDGPDFLTPVITGYQWNANDIPIAGATGKQLLLTEAQLTKKISVIVTYKDNFGAVEPYTSDYTERVASNPETPDGSVTFSGIAKQDETLTATVTDPDGIPVDNSISYQWRVNTANGWADIKGATGKTFVITEAQVGKQIKVAANYTDNKNVVENPASPETGLVANVNDPYSGSVTIQGTTTQGATLVASNTLADPDGIPAGAIHYQWQAAGVNIAGATGSSYTLKQAEVNKTITVVASYTDGHDSPEIAESVATTAVVNINDKPTGAVTIAGIGQQGEMLQASNTLADLDVIPAGAIHYQWKAEGKDIDGATGDSFVVTQAEVDKAITVTASYRDAQGTDESVTSLATSPMLNSNDAPTGLVAITETAKQGQLLTANTAALVDPDGLGTLNYQWQANGKTISGATDNTFILTQAEVGKAITVKVFYTDLFGQPESVRSTPPTAKVENINDVPTGSVTVSGTLKQGEKLTATNTLVDPDGPPALAISYQWQADNVDIAGAYDSSYGLTQEEVGSSITVKAIYKDAYGKDEQVASAATDVIANKNDAPTGIVTIDGITRQGEALTAHTTGLADADGLGALSYQWCVNTGTTVSPVWTSISGATQSDYTLTGSEVGKTVAVKVSYTDNYNYAESVLSRPTQKVSNTNDAPAGTVTITGTAQQGETLTVSNNLVDPDGPAVLPITYQWQADGVDIEGYTGNTLTLEEAQVGKKITAVAIYDDKGGTTEHVYSGETAVVANVNDRYTGSLRISGIAKEKETLKVESTIDDADGLGKISYQWSVVTRTTSGTDNWTAIAGATDATIVLTEAQVGKKIAVKASYTDGHGTLEPVLSNITAPVKNWNSDPTGAVTISGLFKVGKTLAAVSTIDDADGMGAISYQWYANDVTIEGATESSFKLTRAEYLTKISVKASYIDGHGKTEIKESTKTEEITKIYTLSAHDGYLVNALVWIDDNGNKRLDWTDNNRNGKWDKGEGESWALTDSSGQVTGLEGNGTILITANPKGGTVDMSTGNFFTGSFAAPSDAKVVSTLTTLVVAAMAADTVNVSADVKLAAAEARVKAALDLDNTVTIINYDPLAEASKIAATTTGKQIAINVESETIQVNNIMDVAVSVANAVFDKAVANNAETDPYWTEHIVQLVGIIADQLLGQAQPKVNLADATVIANVINNTLNTLTKATTGLYLPVGYTPTTAVITAIANALAKANKNIVAIDNDATGADAPASIKQIIQAQIVAQKTIVTDAYTAVISNNDADINANSANFATLLTEAAAQVATIFINHNPVGNVAINGVVMPGETLTATNSLVDIEGLGTIGYKWYRGAEAITDAIHETYVLNVADIGKAITVKASYIDGAGYSESMSSDPTLAVPHAPTSLSDVVVVASPLTNDATPTVHVDLSNKRQLLEVGDIIQIIDTNHDNAVVASETVTEIGAGVTLQYVIDLLSLVDDTHALTVQLVDGTGNAGLSSNTVTTVNVDTTLPVISDILFKSDPGVVTAALDAALDVAPATREVLYGSVDDGRTWADISGKVIGTTLNWDGLMGVDGMKLQLKIQDVAGNQNIVDVQPHPSGYNLAVHTKYWNNDKLISGVTVDTGILTDNLGEAIIHNVPSGTKTLTPSLTVSQADSNAIGIGDAIGVLKSIVGLTTFNSYQAIAADFDKSGSVGIGDAIGILKHIVGLPSAPTPEWDFVDKTVLTPHTADPINITIGANTTVELIGILLGDVDGSDWSNL